MSIWQPPLPDNMRKELEFYGRRSHPYGHLEDDMRRYDDQLRLAFNRRWGFWQVVRRIPSVPENWVDVRNSVWNKGTSTIPRAPGPWLLHSLFDGRIQVRTPEEAVRLIQSRRAALEEAKAKKQVKYREMIGDAAKSAHSAMEREVVTVDGLRR